MAEQIQKAKPKPKKDTEPIRTEYHDPAIRAAKKAKDKNGKK